MSAPVSFIECVSKMGYTRVLTCVMLALISIIIASIQLNLVIIDMQENYKRRKKKSDLLHFKVYEFETSAKMVC